MEAFFAVLIATMAMSFGWSHTHPPTADPIAREKKKTHRPPLRNARESRCRRRRSPNPRPRPLPGCPSASVRLLPRSAPSCAGADAPQTLPSRVGAAAPQTLPRPFSAPSTPPPPTAPHSCLPRSPPPPLSWSTSVPSAQASAAVTDPLGGALDLIPGGSLRRPLSRRLARPQPLVAAGRRARAAKVPLPHPFQSAPGGECKATQTRKWGLVCWIPFVSSDFGDFDRLIFLLLIAVILLGVEEDSRLLGYGGKRFRGRGCPRFMKQGGHPLFSPHTTFNSSLVISIFMRIYMACAASLLISHAFNRWYDVAFFLGPTMRCCMQCYIKIEHPG
jgi:hypothetical protein